MVDKESNGSLPINRENLLDVLRKVAPGLSPKDKAMCDQASCFTFNGGYLYTYDDEICCRTDSPFPKDFEAVMPGEKLIEFLDKSTVDELIPTFHESQVIFKAKGGEKAHIRLEHEQASLQYIQRVDPPEEEDWKELPTDFAEAVETVQHCASDMAGTVTTCIHIAPEHIEACDRYQLCKWNLETGFNDSTLVRQRALLASVQRGVNEFAETEAWVHFRAVQEEGGKKKEGILLSCRKFKNQEFPDTEDWANFKGDPFNFTKKGKKGTEAYNKQLMDGLDRANIWCKENETDRVTVVLGEGKLVLSSEGTTGGFEKTVQGIGYEGKPIQFRISAKLFKKLLEENQGCEVSTNRLKVEGSNWIYIAALFSVA